MNLKFLLIDDDADDRELFCEALYVVDPQVICYTAEGCRKALLKLDSGEIELPEIIFLDINMPGMNGWQCLSTLKGHELYKKIPVILYSTTSHPEDIEQARHSGALCFFTKPSSFKGLRMAIEQVLTHLKSDTLSSIPGILSFMPQSF